jgi:hypothetical protein
MSKPPFNRSEIIHKQVALKSRIIDDLDHYNQPTRHYGPRTFRTDV